MESCHRGLQRQSRHTQALEPDRLGEEAQVKRDAVLQSNYTARLIENLSKPRPLCVDQESIHLLTTAPMGKTKTAAITTTTSTGIWEKTTVIQ